MWTLDNVILTVEKSTNTAGQSLARLQPLSGGTVFHTFGYADLIKKVSAKIVGYPDQTLLLNMRKDGLTHTLSGAGIYLGEYYVNNVESDMLQGNYQTFLVDANHACTDPVFQVNLELHKDE